MFISLLPRKTASIPMTITAKVPTLMPPAVEPEPPPMNIRITVSSTPLSDRVEESVVANPAVRGVAALKMLTSSFSPKLYPA